jgi:hypothetical protein
MFAAVSRTMFVALKFQVLPGAVGDGLNCACAP